MSKRSRSRPVTFDLDALEEGWIKHDGVGCPVDPASKPRVMFRRGTRMQGAFRADYWQTLGQDRTWWTWVGESCDIVAYKPE